MDPFAHTFAAATLAASGLRKTTPLATATLVLGANVPDIDILTSFYGEYASLAHRRGWTHGVLAMLVLPCLVTAVMLAWDRLVRRKNAVDVSPVNGWVLLMLSVLAVLTHPALDWLNNYGIRLLMPFDGRWYYGDALFVLDPWVWLLLGGGCFLAWSQSKSLLLGWLLFWTAATWLILVNDYVTTTARLIWVGGLLLLLGARCRYADTSTEFVQRWALFFAVLYMATNAIASRQADHQVETMVRTDGASEVVDVMVGPWPANPLQGNVIVVFGDRYVPGSWDWLATPRLHLFDEIISRNMDDPVVTAAAVAGPASLFLAWSRFPYADVEITSDGYSVQFGDARYARLDNLIRGPVVLLDHELQPVQVK